MRRILCGLAVVLFLIGLVGCQESAVTNPKQAKLLTAENAELNAKLTDCQKTSKNLNALLEQCQLEKKDASQPMDADLSKTIDFIFEQTERLTTENKALKAELLKLKK